MTLGTARDPEPWALGFGVREGNSEMQSRIFARVTSTSTRLSVFSSYKPYLYTCLVCVCGVYIARVLRL